MNRHYSLPYPLRYLGFSSPAEAFWATAYRPERRRYDIARDRQQPDLGTTGTHRRTPSIYGTYGTPHSRCLPIGIGRESGSSKRAGFGIIRVECHGRRHQYRYPSSNRRESYPCPDRLRVFQHVDKRSNSSIENKTFRQYGIGILQPYRRTPTRYGF